MATQKPQTNVSPQSANPTAESLVALVEQVRNLVQSARRTAAVHVNSLQVLTNFEIGRCIVEYEQQGTSRAEYGKQVLKELSERLTAEFGRGFSRSNLQNMRTFYLLYQAHLPQIRQKASGKLPAVDDNILELGKGFLFEARQKRFTFGADLFFVDLVFYNRLLRCYVLIDLKIGKLTHQDLGQMQMYVNYFDRYAKRDDEHPTIGIILCKEKNDALVEITLPHDANIFASEYQLYLPSKEDLRQRILEWTMS